MKEQRNILHVVRQFYPAIGGLENYVLNLASAQVNLGHAVTVLTLNKNFNDDAKLPDNEVVYPGINVIRIPWFFSKKYPVAFSVLRYLKQFDLINVHAVDFFADFLALTKVFHRKKMILTTHGGFFHTSWGSLLKKIYFHTITRVMIKAFDAVIGCSENDITVFNRIAPGIKLIHNGVNVEPYLATKKTYKKYELLYVGRIDLHKGVDKLIRLTGILKGMGLPVHLTVAGPDRKKLQPGLKNLAEKSGVADRVTFKGPVSDKELQTLFSNAHVFLSASEYEGFGISAVEAMASGTLCALNTIESFNKLLFNKSFGVLCNFDDLYETAGKVSALLELSATDYYRLSEEAREYAKHFSWENAVKKIEEVYRIIL